MSAAIYYHPEAYSITGPKLMGRNAAGESFLRGYLAHSKGNTLWVQVQQQVHAQHFADTARRYGRTETVRSVDATNLADLTQAGVVYHPGPGLGLHAWQRAAVGATLPGNPGCGAWSLCGITHTTSSSLAMDALSELLIAPVQPWDALICTSTAVRDNVQQLFDAQIEYLRQRLGATRTVLPQLPVIPLGVHCRDFVFSATQRVQARQMLGVDEFTHVVLFVGRLSFHAKAHPLAMYQALHLAAGQLPQGERIVLVECGWHANAHIKAAYAEAAALACPEVRVLSLDGRQTEHRQIAWAGADLFCSLSDNIQETFGITPIEAMAAGLPVVVADWDGYRDTVRDGVDGYRIATVMPEAGLGRDLAVRHAVGIDSYDMYCGHMCSFVAMDIVAAAQALTRLFRSKELRKRMGEAGRRRAREVFDWQAIMGQYEALWSRLHHLRASQGHGVSSPVHPWPARLDPCHAFTGYPTRVLTAGTWVRLAGGDIEAAVRRVEMYRALAMIRFACAVLPSEAEVQELLHGLVEGPQLVADLLSGWALERWPRLQRALSWLLKLGVIGIGRTEEDSATLDRHRLLS